MKHWSIKESLALYSIEKWGKPFFSINPEGNISIAASNFLSNASDIDLYKLIQDLKDQEIQLPVLIRFNDILKHRIQLLNECFHKSIIESKYKGNYCPVFPVKVNQQKHLIEDIVNLGQHIGLGLECGSKPELLIALAKTSNHNNLLVCNGFKDNDYIETALLGSRLGKKVILVVDRKSELDLIIKNSKRLNIKPLIGFRAKLSTQGAGRWIESSGHKSKFGLSPLEIVECAEKLKNENLLDSLELIHFHIGSQVPSIHHIKGALKEGARFYTELYNLGAKPRMIDVGGGLGVDYDGSHSSESSTNYSEQEYANDVVYTIQSICDERGVDHPDIITEAGRAMVAHSSVLVFEVVGCNSHLFEKTKQNIMPQDHQVLRDLRDTLSHLSLKTINESYNDLFQITKDVLQLFTYGVLSLKQRAQADELIFVIANQIRKIILDNSVDKEFEDLLYKLESFLCDTYFCNFSIFQSLPDSWAMGQVFPVMPIHRLNEYPSKRAVLVDLTCDSDGKIDSFIDPTTEQPQNFIEVHPLEKAKPYYMAVFLTGAYQEILGDLHNLFGDTDAVHIELNSNSNSNEEKPYKLTHKVKGDSIYDVLSYVEYQPKDLLEEISSQANIGLTKGHLNKEQRDVFIQNYEEDLYGYTYLKNSDNNEKV